MHFYFSGNPWQGTERLQLEYEFILSRTGEHSRLEPFGEVLGNIIDAAVDLKKKNPKLEFDVTWEQLCEEE